MPEITREAVERVRARVPAELHARVERVAQERTGRPSASRPPGGITQHQDTVTLDDIPHGREMFERVLADTTPQALARKKRQMAGGPRVAGYRDTEFSRAFWEDRQ